MSPTQGQAIAQILAATTQALKAGNLAGAEAALAPFFRGQVTAGPDLFNLAGTLRLHQGRMEAAAALFGQASQVAPRDPVFSYNLALALARLGQSEEAEAAFRATLLLQPQSVPALLELGALLHRRGALDEAEDNVRRAWALAPGHAHAALALGAILLDAARPGEAETVVRDGLAAAKEPRLKARLGVQLAQALRQQRKDAEALAALDAAEALDPALPGLGRHRAETLQHLSRFDDAIASFKKELARTPSDPGLHLDYNALLYQLGRKAELLQSFDAAPKTRELLLGKAFLLAREGRNAEAHAIYCDLHGRDPGDRLAAIGVAQLLTRTGQHGEAMAMFDALLAQDGCDAKLFSIAAEPALLSGDAQKAAWTCEQGLARDPHCGACLGMLSIASRMLEDGRDAALNGYDTLVRSYDLEPPDGFSSMESFNAELDAALDRLHPRSGELMDQSLRGGTQTPGQLFPANLPLVRLLKQRIDEAVARHIAEMAEDPLHPLLSRRSKGFRYSGSWSSRLHDSGYHVNHIHPDGWISSCYYVSVPGVVRDAQSRQGWIKFGEPAIDVALKDPIRRAIQPAPGRLVLFPSFTWHGTVPFQDRAARTTIAFDVVPA